MLKYRRDARSRRYHTPLDLNDTANREQFTTDATAYRQAPSSQATVDLEAA